MQLESSEDEVLPDSEDFLRNRPLLGVGGLFDDESEFTLKIQKNKIYKENRNKHSQKIN